jgi:hypothetical protein
VTRRAGANESDGPAGSDADAPVRSDGAAPAGSDGDAPAGSDGDAPVRSDGDDPAGSDDGWRTRALDGLAASTPWLAFAAVQLLVVLAGALVTDVALVEPRYAFYPVVWITLGAFAVVHAPAPAGGVRRRVVAGALAVAYVGVLLWFTGTVFGMPMPMWGVSFYGGLPGWAPIVSVMAGPIAASFVPFVTFGYLALGYLTYVALTRITRGLAAAVLGPATCVGCVAAGLTGFLAVAGGGGISAAVTGAAYDTATVVYVVAVTALAFVD